jgi:hypothetical protein
MNTDLAPAPRLLLRSALIAIGLINLGATALLAAESSHSTRDIPAPKLVGHSWLNQPPESLLSLTSRKGKVTIVHFWTFGGINCKRNLPAYERWKKRFAAQGVMVIGSHTPETAVEDSG